MILRHTYLPKKWIDWVVLNNEMLTLSHLLLCNVYSFDAAGALHWSYLANPGYIDPNIPVIVERKSMYIYWRNGNHFDVVTSQLDE